MVRAPLPVRWLAAVGAVVGGLTVVLYVAIILGEEGDEVGALVVWSTVMLVPVALALAAAAVLHGRPALWALLVATGLFGVLGLLAIFTIGLLFLLAGACTGTAALVALSGPPHPASVPR